jgi:hypothetical protein
MSSVGATFQSPVIPPRQAKPDSPLEGCTPLGERGG